VAQLFDAGFSLCDATSMLVPVQPTHMVRIKPLGHPLFWVSAPVPLRRHEPGDQQDRQADNEVDHRLGHGSLLIGSRPCLYSRSALTEVACDKRTHPRIDRQIAGKEATFE
jgi:hypothetical protein